MQAITQTQKEESLALAESVLERFESDRLTRVSLIHLNELPALSGVYLATDEAGTVLYIGKASDFADRCKISTHHKLPLAVERGAVFLLVASVPSDQAWHVEQWLIDQISPVLNDRVSRWWIEKIAVPRPVGRPKRTRPTTRKKPGYYIDERVIEALKDLARRTGKSANEYLEDLLFQHCKIQGVIPPDTEELKDLRGGKRKGAGKKPKSNPDSEG